MLYGQACHIASKIFYKSAANIKKLPIKQLFAAKNQIKSHLFDFYGKLVKKILHFLAFFWFNSRQEFCQMILVVFLIFYAFGMNDA